MSEIGGLRDIAGKLSREMQLYNSIPRYNQSITSRHPNDEVDQAMLKYSIYELKEAAKLDKNLLLEFEKEIVDLIAGSSKKGELEVIKEYFRNAIEFSKENLDFRDKVDQKLFRTIIFLCKNGAIATPRHEFGQFKEVLAPIGKKQIDPYINQVLKSVGQLSDWDSDISKIETDTLSEQKDILFARVRNKDGSGSEKIKDLDIINMLNKKLDKPEFIPKAFLNNGRSIYMEYIPHSFEPAKTKTFHKDFYQLTDIIERSWKEGGIVYTDLKPDNIKKRSSGELVITDLGSIVEVSSSDTIFPLHKIDEGVPIYSPPEVAKTFIDRNGLTESIEIEKYLVFMIGSTMLLSMFTFGVDESLKKGHGKKILPDAGDILIKNIPNYSISIDTYKDLRQKFSSISTQEIEPLLLKMIDENPSSRPTLQEVKNYLKSHVNIQNA